MGGPPWIEVIRQWAAETMGATKMVEFVTVGVYGWDEERFFAALRDARVDLLVDIRRRRGVRGSEYAFANSARLQERLNQLGIAYLHRIDLSPSDALRQRQGAADKEEHVARRRRTELSTEFTEGYQHEVLAGFDSRGFVAQLPPEAKVAALLCVERDPSACHRGLLAAHLQKDLAAEIRHLTP
jgi:uncharacterized protein (DUF488 family)